jgi:hypothetical protein
LLTVGAVGCTADPRDDEAMMQPTSVTASAGSDGSGGATDSVGTDSGDSNGSGLILDVGDGMGSGDPDDKSGCDKVDFLFVIDNSGSMSDEQQNLIASFPQFINTIQTTLDAAQDYHVMVLDVDAWVYEGCVGACDQAEMNGCINQNGICDIFAGPACTLSCPILLSCAGYDCANPPEPFECEDVLGAGVVYPRGAEASNMDCGFSDMGERYMDSNEEDLTAAFQCAAKVGTGSSASTEKPMEALVNAVTPSTPAFACNEGFIRDDAILVVTFITDESDDQGDSAGTVDGWRQALISAKNGDETAVVVLGLFGDNDQPNPICGPYDPDSYDGADPAPRLRSFVDSWGDHGFAGSVCASNYDQFFQEAVGIIDTTCEDFVPPQG